MVTAAYWHLMSGKESWWRPIGLQSLLYSPTMESNCMTQRNFVCVKLFLCIQAILEICHSTLIEKIYF